MPEFANAYVDTSHGERDTRDQWNNEADFRRTCDRERHPGIGIGIGIGDGDGDGDGMMSVKLRSDRKQVVEPMATRLKSNRDINPDNRATPDRGRSAQPRH